MSERFFTTGVIPYFKIFKLSFSLKIKVLKLDKINFKFVNWIGKKNFTIHIEFIFF